MVDTTSTPGGPGPSCRPLEVMGPPSGSHARDGRPLTFRPSGERVGNPSRVPGRPDPVPPLAQSLAPLVQSCRPGTCRRN